MPHKIGIQAETFKQLLKYKLRALPKHQRSKTLSIPKPIYPHAIERQYASDLKRLVMGKLTALMGSLLTKENYERWLKDYSKHDSLREDDYENEINRVIGRLQVEAEDLVDAPNSAMKASMLKTAVATYTHSKGQWEKQTEKVLGKPFSTDEAWWEKTRKAWLNENITLIKSQPEEYIKRISDTLYRGVRNGWAWGDMADALQGINTSMSDYKAALIARDQVGKLNGQLSKYRQTEIGISTYNWLGMNDERERDSHRLMNNSLCQWDDSSVYSLDNGVSWEARPSEMQGLIPGEDIQCRCQAVANFDNIQDEANDDIEAEGANTDSIDHVDEGSTALLTGVDDTLISDPILGAAVAFIYQNARVDRSWDIPYLAGSSRDGSIVYVDRHLPEFIEYQGQKYNVLPLFVFHERGEYVLERGLNIPYQFAHQMILRNEKEALAATLKIPWKVYDDFCQKWIKLAYDERLENIPPDLDIKPYEDEKDQVYLLKMQSAIRKELGVNAQG